MEKYIQVLLIFIAGVKREVVVKGIVGVHSWSDSQIERSEVPADDPEHDIYEDFYEEIGISDAFYWFSLEVATSDGSHNMTREELWEYQVVTK